jgi:hypothetical protein
VDLGDQAEMRRARKVPFGWRKMIVSTTPFSLR